MLSIETAEIICKITFSQPALADVYPAFVLRSVFGYYLRRMYCVTHDNDCSVCVFRKTCAYARVFESIIDKSTPVLPGRDKASHPFRIIADAKPGTTLQSLTARIQFFGSGIDYIPHTIFALREAGKAGLFRARIPYTLSVFAGNNVPIEHGDTIELDAIPRTTHHVTTDTVTCNKTYTVQCKTPVRFRHNGKHSDNFLASDFLTACMRRVQTLAGLYGTTQVSGGTTDHNDIQADITNRQLRWIDYTRYSVRQQTAIKLGGVVGSFTVSGTAPAYLWQALETCSYIGTGKNTSFGFGDIRVTEE